MTLQVTIRGRGHQWCLRYQQCLSVVNSGTNLSTNSDTSAVTLPTLGSSHQSKAGGTRLRNEEHHFSTPFTSTGGTNINSGPFAIRLLLLLVNTTGKLNRFNFYRKLQLIGTSFWYQTPVTISESSAIGLSNYMHASRTTWATPAKVSVSNFHGHSLICTLSSAMRLRENYWPNWWLVPADLRLIKTARRNLIRITIVCLANRFVVIKVTHHLHSSSKCRK